MKTHKKPKKLEKKRTPSKISSYPREAKDAFVNQKMLYSVRDELIAHTEKKFHEVKSEIHEVKSEIHEVKAVVAQLEKSIHRVALQMEEQNNRNKIVLDGLAQLFDRQERIEKKIDSGF